MSYSNQEEKSPFMVIGGEEKSTVPVWVWVLAFMAISWAIYLILTAEGTWQTSEWSKCSAICDGGSQTRTVTCSSYTCDPTTRPMDMQKCEVAPCWSKTAAHGGGGGGKYEFKCPPGHFVEEMPYKFDKGLNQVRVRCNTGLPSGLSAAYGGNAGVDHSFKFPSGINSFYVTGNKFVGNITPGTESKVNLNAGGRAEGEFSGPAKKLSCPEGSKIAGIYGGSGTLVDSLGFHCYKFA